MQRGAQDSAACRLLRSVVEFAICRAHCEKIISCRGKKSKLRTAVPNSRVSVLFSPYQFTPFNLIYLGISSSLLLSITLSCCYDVKCCLLHIVQEYSLNPALRLKDEVLHEIQTAGVSPGPTIVVSRPAVNEGGGKSHQTDKLQWQYFDERAYVDKTKLKPGQDAYARNKFNQAASDQLMSNRDIPDSRHPL